jgi:hypothetical protein
MDGNCPKCLFCGSNSVFAMVDGKSIICNTCIQGRTPHYYNEKTHKIEFYDDNPKCQFCGSRHIMMRNDGGSIICLDCEKGKTAHHFCEKTKKIETDDHCPAQCKYEIEVAWKSQYYDKLAHFVSSTTTLESFYR